MVDQYRRPECKSLVQRGSESLRWIASLSFPLPSPRVPVSEPAVPPLMTNCPSIFYTLVLPFSTGPPIMKYVDG